MTRGAQDRITLDAVRQILCRYLPLYEHRQPVYQTVLLQELAREWGDHRCVLDVGGGSGVVGQAIHELFATDVTSIDIHDRYAKGLTTKRLVFDGKTLPFADASFDGAIINNVLHHVPRPLRGALLRECRRVCAGPVYIKDHLVAKWTDHVSLAILDAIGNIPFGGMVWAQYLTSREWQELAAESGYLPPTFRSATYRSGLVAAIFPNRLEIVTKWMPRANQA